MCSCSDVDKLGGRVKVSYKTGLSSTWRQERILGQRTRAGCASMSGMTVEPLRASFRRQVRERAVEVTRALVLERGWDAVRMADVAAQAGVSRPTLYDEFGSKQGLAEALAISEAETFLRGISAVLADAPADPAAAISTATRYTFEQAARNPLL